MFVTVVLCHGQRATFSRKVLNQAAFSGPWLEEDCVIVTIVLCHKWWVAFGRLVLHQAAFGGTWLEQYCVIVTILLCHRWWVASQSNGWRPLPANIKLMNVPDLPNAAPSMLKLVALGFLSCCCHVLATLEGASLLNNFHQLNIGWGGWLFKRIIECQN